MFHIRFGWKKPSVNGVQCIEPLELYTRLQQREHLLIVDVRSSAEYAHDGHITGARLLPLPVLLQRSNELPRNAAIVFVCRSGMRSRTACEQLMLQGFSNVLNLTGGILSWRKAGLPITS